MVQVKELSSYAQFMMAAIAEREGIEMADAHAAEKTEFELSEHFEAYYKVFVEDADQVVIVQAAREQMTDREFVLMLEQNDYCAPFEALALEGYLTKIDRRWVLSLEKYWEPTDESEGWVARC